MVTVLLCLCLCVSEEITGFVQQLIDMTMFRRRIASPPDIRLRVEGRNVTFSDIASFSRDIITGSLSLFPVNGK